MFNTILNRCLHWRLPHLNRPFRNFAQYAKAHAKVKEDNEVLWKEYCADQFGFKTERKRKKVYESKGEWKWKAAVDEWLIGEGRDERWNLSIQNRAYGAYETQVCPFPHLSKVLAS